MTGPRIVPDDYQSLIDQDKASGSQALRTSMSVANRQPVEPERMAKILTLADQAKLPAGVVERNYDQVHAAQASQTTDYDSIIHDTPGLAKWLEDPHNATLARNEVPALQRVHRGASLLSLVPDPDAMKRDALGAVATGFSDLDAAAAHILVAFGRISPEEGAQHIAEANRQTAELNAMKPDYAKEFSAALQQHAGDVDKAVREFSAYQGSQRRQNVLAALKGIGGPADVIGDVAAAVTNPAAPKTVGQLLSLIGAAIARPRGLTYATVEQLAGSLPAMGGGMGGAMVGGAVGSVVPVIGTAAGSAAGMAAGTFLGAAPVSVGGAINAELQKRGVNTSDEHALLTAFNDPALMARVRAVAERQGMTSAAVQSIFASFAGKFASKALAAGAGKAAVVGATAADAAIQAGGMAAAEQAGQAAADKSTKNLSLGQAAVTGVQMLGYSLGETALGASRRALFHADPVEGAQQATVMASDALKVEHDVQALTEIGAAVKEAKATSQVPDRLKSLVEMATANNENAQVYFQSGDWDEFWQSQGASPAKAYDDIVGDGGKGYYEAKSTGSRIVIPIADYIAKVAPTDHWEGLLEHARTSVDGMSLGEAQEHLTSLPATLTELANEAHGQTPTAEGEAAKPSIGEHVQAQLEKAGVPKAQAKAQSALYESAFKTLGERSGIDPQELFDRYALDITSEKAPKSATEATGRAVTPEEAARRANLQAAAESALERLGMRDEEITAKGTYDLPHEERDTNAKNDARLWTYARTKAGVLRSNLKSVSTEGLIDEIARLNDANNEDAAKVIPTVSAEANVSHVSGDLRHHVSIKGEGINASGRIKQRAKSVERLESHLAERLGSPEAAQDAIASRMAERDTGGFGQYYDQPAYHGSSHIFDEFSLHHIGSGEGAQAYGWGLYFAGKKAVAEFYRENLSTPRFKALSDAENAAIPEWQRKQIIAASSNNGSPKADRASAQNQIRRALSDLQAEVETGYPPRPEQKAALEKLLAEGHDQAPAGRLYKVDIPDDDTMLLWEKPIGDQPKAVQERVREILKEKGYLRPRDDGPRQLTEAFKAYAIDVGGMGDGPNGALAYELIGDHIANDPEYSTESPDHSPAEAGSRWLASQGVTGIKYPDSFSRGKGNASHNYVIFDDRLVKIMEFEQSQIAVGEEIPAEGKKYRPTQAAIRDLAEQKGISFEEAERRLRAAGYNQDARGRIRIGENRQISIDLLKGADRSTFLHETGHFYLEVMHDLAEQSPAIADDLKTIRGWVGADEGANFTREQHEQFARGFEAYLMEGKAPSVALGDAFYRFKTWLVGIYRQLRNLNVELTPDVRKVFDRLLATDDEISAAEKAQAVEPLFDDPRAVGLSDAQAEAYSRAVADARRTAEEEVTQRVMKEIRREESAQWKEWRAPILDAVTEEVNARPEYRALAFLKDGTNPDGTPLEEGTPTWKLEREALRERYPDVQLPESLTELSERGGMDPDIAAEVFGYDSGRDLVEALAKAPPREKLINSLADQRTVAEHGDRMSDADLRDAATKAVRGEKRAQVLRKELEILASSDMAKLKGLVRAITKPIPPTEAVRQEAAKIIGARPVNEIRPIVYERAAKKLAADAREALLRGDVEAAFDLKRKELLTNEVFRAATDAKESIETALGEFKKVFARDEKISQTRDIDLVNAARSILSSYGIGRTDKTPAEYLEQIRRYDESTYETVQAMVAAAAAQAGDYKTLSYDDFSAVRETVSSLWTLARRTRQIEIDGKRIDRQMVQGELAARLAEISTPSEKPGYKQAVTQWEKTKHYLMGARAFLRRTEFWVDAVDSGKPDGVFRRYIWNPISEATTKYRVAKRETLTKYLELVKPVEQTMKSEPIPAPELGYTFRGRAELLGALLHRGNESNLQKLLRGRHWGDFTEDHVLDRSRWDAFEQRMQKEGKLTKTDYDYVQGVWNLFEELKPASQKAHKEMFGHYFSEITAEPFQTPYGTYQGGYYPALTDNFIVTDQALRREAEAFLQGGNGFMFPTTGRGFTKSRVEAYARPLVLDAATVPLGIDAVLRFTHIEPRVRDVARVIMNPDFRPHLDDFDPTIGKEMLVPWLQRAAQQRTQMPGLHAGVDKFWREVRSRTGLQVLSANVIVALEQITHMPGAAIKVSPRHLAGSLWRFMHSPNESAAAITEKSDYMRTRETAAVMEIQKTIDNLLLDPSKYEKVRDFAREHGNFMSRAVQHVSDVMTWNGAYEQAIERGADEKGAVREADSIVRETQGSYAPEDLSRFETSTAFLRTFSLFYSFFNAKANLLGSEFSTTARDLGLRKGAGRMLYVYALGLLVPAVMASAVKHVAQGQPFDEDDDGPMDDVFRLFFESQAEMATRFVPVVGPVVSSTIGAFTKKPTDDDIMISPAVKMIESAAHAPADVYKAIHDRTVSSRGIKDVLTLLGLLSNLPLAPLAKPIGYAHDVSTGRAKPSGTIDRIRGSITGQAGPHF